MFYARLTSTELYSRRLQAVRNRDCWVFGNRWRRV